MPYKLSENGLCVEKADTGEIVKCHKNHADAMAHLHALQMNVNEAKMETKQAQTSLSDMVNTVHEAFYQMMNPSMDMPMSMPCVEEVFGDYVIAEVDDKYYQITFKMDADGKPVFAPREQWVEMEEAWQPVKGVEINDDMLINYGSPIKKLNGIGEPDFAIVYGGRDLVKDFFEKETEYGFAGAKTKRVPIMFNHAQPLETGSGKRYVERKPIGEAELEIADEGLLIKEAILYNRKKYKEYLNELGWSTGAASHAVVAEPMPDGRNRIKQWIVSELSVTPMSAEPRLMNVVSIKSLITSEAKPSGAEPQKEQGDTNKVTTKESIMDNELKALFDAQKADIAELVKTEAAKTVTDILEKLPEVKANMNATVQVVTAAEDRQFKNIGENAIAVSKHVKGLATHPRIRGLQAMAIAAAKSAGDEVALEAAYKAALGSNEAIPSQGEFLLEPTITRDLIKPVHEDGIFSTKVRKLPVGPNSNSGWIPGVDETSRATGSRWGGVRGYHAAEAASLTASQPKFRKINWELHKTTILQYATDELLNDAPMLSAIINQSSAEELNFMVNDDLLNGIGGDRPVGVLNSNALISVSRAATSAISHADILSMWQRLHPRFRAGAEWYINSEAEPQLDALTFTSGSTGILSPYVRYDANGVMNVKGRPVNVTEFNPALGTAGDILLANFDDYLMWEKGAVEAAMSIHVQFLTDQTAFRFIARYDGQTALASAITPYKGTNTQSPFVTLLATT